MPRASTASLRVAKTIAPTAQGALKLARKFGDELLCVRYRHDAQGLYRYTTVELVVERAPIQSRSETIVGVKIGYLEKSLRTAAQAGGAKWDPSHKLWKMPRRLATRLGLHARVAER